jgi:hypothetical protein
VGAIRRAVEVLYDRVTGPGPRASAVARTRLIDDDRSASVIIGSHAFVQNVRRGHYELAAEELVNRRLAVAFDELALTI